MEMLSHLMVMLMDEEFCQKLLDADSVELFLSLIDAQERVKFPSMAFGCASPAPHGGLFVLPVLHNPLGFAAAVAIGSVAGMVVLGLLKKKKA